MRILGVDPGTLVLGYAVMDSQGDDLAPVTFGAFNCPRNLCLSKRLGFLYQRLLEVVSIYRPDVLAVEEPFVAKNISSAFTLGKAQAVAILVAANSGIEVFGYPPAEVKKVVVGYGRSTKEQIRDMVRLELGLSSVLEPIDAADALAVAICHHQEEKLKNMLGQHGD